MRKVIFGPGQRAWTPSTVQGMVTCLRCPAPAVEGESLCQPCLALWASENGIDLVRRGLSRENELLRAENQRLRTEIEGLQAGRVIVVGQSAQAARFLVQGVEFGEYWDAVGDEPGADPRRLRSPSPT